jgi:hypothetical protein
MADYISKYETGAAVDAALDLAMSALQPESGKGLSTNDFTNEYKNKVDSNDAEISSARGSYATMNERLSGIESEQESQGTALDEDRAALVEIVDSGAKNKLINSVTDGQTFGISFAKNADETITVSGTASGGNAQRRIMTIPAEDVQKYNGMVLSGCPAGGSNNTYRLIFQRDSSPYTIYTSDIGEGAIIQDVPAVQCRVFIIVNDGTSIDGTFKPMLCTKAAWDISQQYVPHRPSYDELIARIEALEAGT